MRKSLCVAPPFVSLCTCTMQQLMQQGGDNQAGGSAVTSASAGNLKEGGPAAVIGKGDGGGVEGGEVDGRVMQI